MAKYKRYEWPVIAQAREQHAKPPRHAHVRLRGVSTCLDCGASAAWTQLAQYEGVCRWCWESMQLLPVEEVVLMEEVAYGR
jgi:hypothetical protein